MDKKISIKVPFLISVIVYLGIGIFFIGKSYPFSILPDEFGYWQNIAFLRGKDWSAVNALGDYYSYGYSSFLFPVFALVKSPLTAYRVALWANIMMLLVGEYALIRSIESDRASFLFILYPPLIYYALTTMSEAALFMVFAISLVFLKRYLKSRKMLDGLILIVLLVFLFTIHMRTLPLLVIAVLLMRDKVAENSKGRKSFIVFLGACLILLAIALAVGGYFQKPIVMANGAAGTGFYAVFSKMKRLYTIKGIGKFVVSLVGEVFYIGVASLGLGCIGLIRIIEKVKQKRDFEYFLLVALICEMAVSALFLYSDDSSMSVLYGRYIDYMVPVLTIYGLSEIAEHGINIKKLLVSAVVLSVAAIIVFISTSGYGQIENLFALGADYLMVRGNKTLLMIISAVFLCVVYMLICLAVKRAKTDRVGKNIPAIALFVLFALFTCNLCYDMVYGNLGFAKENAELAADMREDDIQEIIYLKNEGGSPIQVIQFMIPDKPVRVVDSIDELEEYEDKDKCIVVGSYDTINEQLNEKYELFGETRTFKVWR